jgi:hypothetical protein
MSKETVNVSSTVGTCRAWHIIRYKDQWVLSESTSSELQSGKIVHKINWCLIVEWTI